MQYETSMRASVRAHRTGGTEVDVVGMGRDHEDALDLVVVQHRSTLLS